MKNYRNSTQAPDSMPDRGEIPQQYHISASTHEGKLRGVNEDNFTVNGIVGLEEGARRSLSGRGLSQPLVCAVFDGTGGGMLGVAAARMAADCAVGMYESYVRTPSDRERLLSRFVGTCSASISGQLVTPDGYRGATTFVMAVINNGRLHAYSMGDSRLYLYTDGRLYVVSNDHTVAMDKYREGIYTREQAQRSPDRRKLTLFLGIEPASAARAEKYETIHLKKGDRLLLCTDGLYSMVSDPEIADVLGGELPDKARELIELALQAGGKDNVTCTVVECA